MRTKEFVKMYGVAPSHVCDRDILSVIYLGCIIVHSKSKDSHEFAVAVPPPPGRNTPDDTLVGKATSAGLKLHRVADDGSFLYLFNPANERHSRLAIELAGLDRCTGPGNPIPWEDQP